MIPARLVFEEHAGDYDTWFDEHNSVYQAQLRILRGAILDFRLGLEVGVGSGRFAVPLGVQCGIDPSQNLVRMAKQRGVEVALGEAEHLPYRTGSFDIVIMMTVICFLDDIPGAFHEAYRVLASDRTLVAGFIEADGEIFQEYQHEQVKGRFLRFATFRTLDEIYGFFRQAGFEEISVLQKSTGILRYERQEKDAMKVMDCRSKLSIQDF